ncbi:hypothetical protein FPQ18DRAFT_405424 [Pyronema domesticum]|uniref:Protein farnesyltransferase/geranylgeranyltransferase type-1 subunit alpha n=1 Tax=Pyronema omphalodes (strain CBS 100304) TaxID=1076935 RepID=U4L8L1_PYROM|nr:hypothetical protein FPQ18DRAFT_405424 [Pyronema domesticum]CCX14245.1 Similar to Protein farnesyltransferase/geranylgeranyltransferase type-1 subunit alpha; acc. no. P29702 [Pyronema omphalodes CBS 100304]
MYQERPEWEDVIPLPQDDGALPLAQIAYTDEYAEAMSYLRALMAKDEHSERALEITEHIIEMNPAHYTVWLYRANIVFALGKDLRKEVEWLNEKALRHEKNYQIWHHRQLIIDKLDDSTGEADFIAKMFQKDAKNYHVWSYRQWLVKRFGLWEKGELEYVEYLLEQDVRNNSAWSHRFFLVCGNGQELTEEIVQRELGYVSDNIFLAPQNPSPWNYIRGILQRAKLPMSRIEKTCTYYAPLDNPEKIKSSHALDILAEIYSTIPEQKDLAIQSLDLLSSTYDPIRTNYWNYRKTQIQKAAA